LTSDRRYYCPYSARGRRDQADVPTRRSSDLTGRTQQIRVHCTAIRHPIVGDKTYGFKKPLKMFEDIRPLKEIICNVPRQMLHAWHLGFLHPETGKNERFEGPLPDDMSIFIDNIKKF